MAGNRMRAIVELVGLIAVVLSLLLVAYEVRQSNRIAQATTTYEIARDVNQFNELGYADAEFAELLLLLTTEKAEASDVQSLQARLLAHRFVNLWTVQAKAYDNGLLSRAQFDATKRDVQTVMTAFPGLLQHWEHVFTAQPTLFESEVLESLASVLEERR